MQDIPMPYSKQHKDQTRKKILKSAYRLFTAKGFEGVTVNELMENCNLTRGAFYAHFSSKALLYSESIKFAATTRKLTEIKPNDISDKTWLGLLLDRYLSVEHVNGSRPCPLTFLVTDIITRDSEAKLAYASAYNDMNKVILTYANSYTSCDEDEILTLTAMIIGAVAIARTMDNKKAVKKLLTSCREAAGMKLGGI